MRVPLRDNGDLAGDLLGWCSSSGEAGPLPPPNPTPPPTTAGFRAPEGLGRDSGYRLSAGCSREEQARGGR